MKRPFFITLTVLASLAALSFSLYTPFKMSTQSSGDNTQNSAALFNAHGSINASSTLEETPENDAAVLIEPTRPDKQIDTSALSPTSTDFTHPSERVAKGIPSATSTKSARIPVVVYHTLRPKHSMKRGRLENPYNVPPDIFEKELKYLSDNGYTTLTYSDMSDIRLGTKKLPEKPIILTFDDGLIDHYTIALPALERYDMKAVFYVYPNPINHKNKKWMSWDQVRALRDAGMEIGSHTYTHPYLTKIVAPTWETEKPLLDKEIVAPKTELEQKLGIKVLSIAYPFGLYNARVLASAHAAGYEFGRTIWPGTWQDPAHDLEWSAQILTDNFNLFKNYLEKK